MARPVPTNLLPDSAAQADSVRLGVSNREPGQIGYRLLVTASGTIIGSWPRITLGPQSGTGLAAPRGIGGRRRRARVRRRRQSG